MHYHIILTEKCNSRCKYCYEKSMKEFENGLEEKWEYDNETPVVSEVEIEKLKNFLSPKDTLIFYGGEPLLEIEKIKEIMDSISCRFCMQTNGKLLHTLPSEYLNRISKILISIDGNKERTDFNRGPGSYEFILKNINLIRKNKFKGEIVARMTLNFPDIFEQIKNILDTNIFDSIHWQIDAGFYKNDFNEEEFSKFVKEYNSQISKLIELWISEMEKGKVLKLYPLIGITNDLSNNTKTKLRCGSGYANYSITTNGNLSACPIMNSVKNFYCGNLNSKKLKEIYVSGKCNFCEYLDLCGGRCLYSNYAQLWPEKGEELICETIKFLIDSLKKALPRIERLVEKGVISKKDFDYEKYFGPEIIP